MKPNLSKTKELVIRGRTTLPPPEPIVTIKRVSYLKLLGYTTYLPIHDVPTSIFPTIIFLIEARSEPSEEMIKKLKK